MRISLTFLIMNLILWACNPAKQITEKVETVRPTKLSFQLVINRENYLNSVYGESPQIAIWLEDSSCTEIKNIYVTHRSGKNDWHGKINCEVALPFWKSRLEFYSKKTEKTQNDIDGITKATSKNDMVNVSIYLEPYKVWRYFIEVNVAGDYNEYYQPYTKDGIPDTEGNGQPSIIYSGTVNLKNGIVDNPEIIGRTMQLRKTDKIVKDLSTITSAKEIFSSIKVKVL